MKIMKLLASCAMVGALTAVCASGAFADAAVTATYTAADAEAETGAKVTVAVTDYAVTGDYTVLVLNADVDAESRGDNAGKVTNADITQIDQWNGTTTIELALPDDIADGTYYVRVGGAESGYVATTFTVGSTKSTRKLGDCDNDNAVGGSDATQILLYSAGKATSVEFTGDNLQAADCDDDGAAGGSDATQILLYSAGKTTTADFTKTVGDKVNKVPEA